MIKILLFCILLFVHKLSGAIQRGIEVFFFHIEKKLNAFAWRREKHRLESADAALFDAVDSIPTKAEKKAHAHFRGY